MPNGLEPQRHVVVFDCNVYLDVGRVLGSPYSRAKLDAAVAKTAKDPVPHRDPAQDSLRALALCTSGRFAGGEVLEVWTNAHIEKLVLKKAQQSAVPDPVTGNRGLGWSLHDARSLVDDLIVALTESSNGGNLGTHYPDSNPPLDHEDGMVYGACRWLSADDPVSQVYCVTRDRDFLQAYRDGHLSGHSRVLKPASFVQLVRTARRVYSIRRMRGPSA